MSEWTREKLDALKVTPSYSNFQSGYWNWLRGQAALRDAILASQPERVVPQFKCGDAVEWYGKLAYAAGVSKCLWILESCGQSLKGAGE